MQREAKKKEKIGQTKQNKGKAWNNAGFFIAEHSTMLVRNAISDEQSLILSADRFC